MKVRSAFKIAAVYAFALTTAVACGKFEPKKATEVRGTSNGTVQVVAEGPPGAVAAFNITFDRVEPIAIGSDEYFVNSYKLEVDFSHGSRKLKYQLFPSPYPYTQDEVEFVIAPMDYKLQGVCGNEDCSRYAVLIDVTDTSNGTQFQRVEYWDRMISTTAPQKRLTDTDYTNVSDAYEALSFQSLN